MKECFLLLLVHKKALFFRKLNFAKHHFPVVLFIMPYKVVLTESVDEILKNDN